MAKALILLGFALKFVLALSLLKGDKTALRYRRGYLFAHSHAAWPSFGGNKAVTDFLEA